MIRGEIGPFDEKFRRSARPTLIGKNDKFDNVFLIVAIHFLHKGPKGRLAHFLPALIDVVHDMLI